MDCDHAIDNGHNKIKTDICDDEDNGHTEECGQKGVACFKSITIDSDGNKTTRRKCSKVAYREDFCHTWVSM